MVKASDDDNHDDYDDVDDDDDDDAADTWSELFIEGFVYFTECYNYLFSDFTAVCKFVCTLLILWVT